MIKSWIWLMLAAGIVEGLGDVAFKQWSKSNSRLLFVAGALAYLVATVLWAPTLREKELYRMLGVFFCGNLIIGTAIGVFGYDEAVTIQTGIGLLCALAAIILLA